VVVKVEAVRLLDQVDQAVAAVVKLIIQEEVVLLDKVQRVVQAAVEQQALAAVAQMRLVLTHLAETVVMVAQERRAA
jgi:hypothetical protein